MVWMSSNIQDPGRRVQGPSKLLQYPSFQGERSPGDKPAWEGL